MGTLLADSLKEVAGASSTNTTPAMALVAFAGEPTYCIAWKGENSVDAIHLSGAPAISGATTDAGPALAVDNRYGSDTLLYLAWKIPGAGGQGVKVSQCVMGVDGFPGAQSWTSLNVDPPASTDVDPALAVGPSGELYVVWKQPGANAALAWSVYQGGAWSPAVTIPDTITNHHPAVMALSGTPVTLCLAYTASTTQFILTANYTPGDTSIEWNYPVGYASDAAPALTPGLTGATYYLIWKQQGQTSLAFAPVTGENIIYDVTTLPQVETDAAPAAVNWSNDTSGFGAEVFNNLIVAWKGQSNGDVVQGFWTIPATPPAAQPAAGLGGASNYYVYSDCKNLTGVAVTVTISQDMLSSNGFGFQLNCTPPKGKTCVWQQYAFCIDTSGNVWGVVNNWNAAGTMILQWESNFTLPTPTLTAGYSLTITLQYGQNDIVTGATFSVAQWGQQLASLPVALDQIDLYKVQPPVLASTPDFAAIVAMQMDIVGYDNFQVAKFSKGAGQISYTANEALSPIAGEPPCAEPTNGTGENGNTFYGALPTTSGNTVTQGFATSTEVEMIHVSGRSNFLPPRTHIVPGPIIHGPVVPAPVTDGPVIHDPEGPGPVVHEPVIDGPVIGGPVHGPAIPEPVIGGPVTHDPVIHGPAEPTPVEPSTAPIAHPIGAAGRSRRGRGGGFALTTVIAAYLALGACYLVSISHHLANQQLLLAAAAALLLVFTFFAVVSRRWIALLILPLLPVAYLLLFDLYRHGAFCAAHALLCHHL